MGENRRGLLSTLVLVAVVAFSAQAEDKPAPMTPANAPAQRDGTVSVPAFELPFSVYASEEARRRLVSAALDPPPWEPNADIARQRELYDRHLMAPWLERARAAYATDVEERTIAGIRVHVVTPKEGVAKRNRHRVLVNLHGGAFSFGAVLGAQVESIPIASVGRIKVITVDYRMAPEHRFPAASEDVAAVYRELLKEYRPENIGIYGCSAGGMLTAMSLAWFQKEQLPTPGAAGIFCASADASLDGDASYTSGPLGAQPMRAADRAGPALPMAYLDQADLRDPLVSPQFSQATLAKFPPTLLLSGTRAFEFSSAVETHRQLTNAGVEARLHAWDGVVHGFVYDVTQPEAREAYAVAAKFFDHYLGSR